jgi:ATP-dependent DNA ligase
VPSGDRWIHEIKFDGYRVQLHIHNDAIKILTRRGNDWTRRFTDDGIENLQNLIAIHKDDPSIIEKSRQALAAMIKPKSEESDEV